jgi:hypothetical protein
MRKLIAGAVVVALIAWVAWGQWQSEYSLSAPPGEFLANRPVSSSGGAATHAAYQDKVKALEAALDASHDALRKQGDVISFLETEVNRLRVELAACEEQNR